MPKDTIKIFIDDVIAAAGFVDMSEDAKAKFRERVELAFAKRLGTASLALLSGKDLLDFQKLTDQKTSVTPQRILEFFDSHIPKFDTKIVEIMKEFQAEFVRAAKAVAV